MIIAHGLVWPRWVISLMCRHTHTRTHAGTQARTTHPAQMRAGLVGTQKQSNPPESGGLGLRAERAHTWGQMRAPGHPNKPSVRWIYCKQSLQEDHPAAARQRETSGLATQRERDGLADSAGREEAASGTGSKQCRIKWNTYKKK